MRAYHHDEMKFFRIDKEDIENKQFFVKNYGITRKDNQKLFKFSFLVPLGTKCR
jgi:hypothetical protein